MPPSAAPNERSRQSFFAKLRPRMAKASIRSYLIAMVCAIALPVLAFVALLLAQLQFDERVALERRTEREAQLLATSVSRVLQEMSTTLRLLITSPELDAGDLEAFHNRAQAALQDGPLYVILVDEDGQQLLNTRVPYGTDLGKTSNIPALESVLRSGEIEVSDVFIGKTSGHWVFNVTLPLPAQLSSSGAALIITKNANELSDLTATEGLPAGWSAAILDHSGNLVSSSKGTDVSHNSPFEADLPRQFTQVSGVVYGAAGDPDSIVGFARLRGWSWNAVVWGPVASAQASLLTTWRQLIFGGTALLALAVAAAIFLARQLRISVRGIADMAEQVGHGEVVAPIATQIVEVDTVAKALSSASFDRSQAEDQIHLMIGELAHRTKNLLAVTQAMIHQSARRSKSVDEFHTAISERIAGLGRSTDLLTSKQWSGVPIKRLIDSHLTTFLESPQQLDLQGEDFLLKPTAVQNLGLILHELATNATKYGALSTPGGHIAIAWESSDPEAGAPELTIIWRETGAPPASTPVEKGFGSQILERHATAAFRGRVTLDFDDGGCLWILQAPEETFTDDIHASISGETSGRGDLL
jgi:two-component sensor histidine kinase